MWGREKPKEKQPAHGTPQVKAVQSIETTIGPNTHVKGSIQGDGGLRIEGVVEGNVETTGNVVITESAKVLSEIKANNISIAGAVQGDIHANRVEILETGRVWGDLNIKALLINEGAYLSGQTIMPQDLKPPTLETPKPTPKPKPPTPSNQKTPKNET
ncbi:MAG: bactofilin family protein [Anaerolineae bacterium]